MRPSERPNLTNPDGTPLAVSGYVPIWVRLPNETRSKKLKCFVVDRLMNKMLIGLPALKKLRWIPKDWPDCIGKEQWKVCSKFELLSDGGRIKLVDPDFLVVCTGEKMTSVREDDFSALPNRQRFVRHKLSVKDVH